MQIMSKGIISFVVIAVFIAGGVLLWWAGLLDGLTSNLNLNILHPNTAMTEDTIQSQGSEPELETGDDTSDQALEQDLQQLDAEFQTYGETSSDLDASLQDEPVEQDSNF